MTIDPMLVVCHKLAAAQSVMNDGPDDSDAEMAMRYVAEAATIAAHVVRSLNPSPNSEEAKPILEMLRMGPNEVIALMEAQCEETPDVT